MMDSGAAITLEPDGAGWAGAIREAWARLDDRARTFRGEVGLPTDRPVVMTGHQAELWHPGILAKWFAAEAAAAEAEGAAVWLVADQDTNDALAIRAPLTDDGGSLVGRTIHPARPAAEIPTGLAPPGHAAEPAEVDRLATGDVAARFGHAIGALRSGARASTAAGQAQTALRELLGELFAPSAEVWATRLGVTTLFGKLVRTMRDDPAAMARAYNESAAESMGAGVAPLDVSRGRVELPVWRVGWGRPRERVYADHLGGIDPAELAPRALLMTAMVRLAGCELFVHGTGGAAYDRVTERWIERWLGERLSPAALATADLPLDLPGANVGEQDVARARWRAHHARHAPEEAGRDDLAAAKSSLVERIRGAERGAEVRASLFREMHRLLADYRAADRDALEAIDAEAERTADLARSAAVARARDWSIALYDRRDLRALRRSIRERFGAPEACAAPST